MIRLRVNLFLILGPIIVLVLAPGPVVTRQYNTHQGWMSAAYAGEETGMPMNENGLITIQSHNSVKVTVERLEARLKAGGITIFARVDHAAGAASVGMPLRPSELLIFGNPQAGTPLMQANQTIGLDLPLKVLVWEDANGAVWITYNDVSWLARRHNLPASTTGAVKSIADALTKLTQAAAD
jgi:uncharacterized protein (DUF302 family)